MKVKSRKIDLLPTKVIFIRILVMDFILCGLEKDETVRLVWVTRSAGRMDNVRLHVHFSSIKH